jgi:hypothetical protein
MGLFDAFRRGGRRSRHVIGRISDEPKIAGDNGERYLVFHLEETPDTEFRLRMLPTTPKRRKGDRVEITWTQGENGTATVEMLSAAPDQEFARRRNEAYLQEIQARGMKDQQ